MILVFKVYFQICFLKMNYFINCKTILSGSFGMIGLLSGSVENGELDDHYFLSFLKSAISS